MLVFP
jgi:hypothetical protein